MKHTEMDEGKSFHGTWEQAAAAAGGGGLTVTAS